MQIWWNNACLCKLVSSRNSRHTSHTFHTNATFSFLFFFFHIFIFIYITVAIPETLCPTQSQISHIYISHEWPNLRLSAQLSLRSWRLSAQLSLHTHTFSSHFSHHAICIYFIILTIYQNAYVQLYHHNWTSLFHFS